MNLKLKSRLPGEISITSDMQVTSPLWQKAKKNWRASWWEWKRIVKKLAYNSTSENWDHGIQSHHFMANRCRNSVNSDTFYFGGLQNHCRWWLFLLLGRKAMSNLGSILTSRDITLPTKVHLVKAMVFPVVMNRCESWIIRKAECWRIGAFELWY